MPTVKAKPGGDIFKLSEEDIQALLAWGEERSFSKGQEVFLEGEESHHLWFVKSGRIHLVKSSSTGAESLIAFYGPGHTFCIAAALIGKAFPCSARAAVDSSVVAIPADRFLKLFEALPVFAKRLLRELAPQFCTAHCECAMNIESVDKRLAHTLLRLDGHFTGQPIPFTRQELAQMVNTTVESCIRKLSAWTKKGWIEGSRGEVRVVNRSALEEVLSLD